MKKRILAITAIGFMLAAVTAVGAQQPGLKIGVFDPLRVSEETEEGKRVATDLKKYFDNKQGELNQLQQQLIDLQQRAQAQALSLSEAKRQELNREIQRKTLELTSARDTATRELQLEQAEAQSQFEQQLLRVVESFAQREGFSLILDRNAVVYAAQGVDVTTGIVDLFNELVPAGGQAEAGQ